MASNPYEYNGTPADCRPINDETVIEVVSGPNKYGQHSFFAYWNDGYLPPSGVRGQIFLANLTDFVSRHPNHRFVDRRK
jgi:hypothetical protein